MTPWRLVVVMIAALGLGVLATLLLRDDDHATLVDGAADRQVASNSSAPSSPNYPLTSSPAPRETADPTTSPAAPARRIQTSSSTYFGRPFETIQIAGRYRGVRESRELRVQVRQPSGWTAFPLPVFTQPSGEFRAYVELGTGQYELRIVDPENGRASAVLTLLVF